MLFATQEPFQPQCRFLQSTSVTHQTSTREFIKTVRFTVQPSQLFQPTEMANNLKEYGSFIPGIRPGRKTAEFLERVMTRITLVGAGFLALIAILPTLVADMLKVDPGTASFLGGTGVLIIVGVALDIVDKLNSHLLERNYDGFMSSGSAKRGRR